VSGPATHSFCLSLISVSHSLSFMCPVCSDLYKDTFDKNPYKKDGVDSVVGVALFESIIFWRGVCEGGGTGASVLTPIEVQH
jgi:hypothetical protein